MQKLFVEVNSLDKRCYEQLALSEDLLMEHAALAMAQWVQQNLSQGSSVTIVCGCGNNGADGLALARLLHKYYVVNVFLAMQPQSAMAKLQYKRLERLGIQAVDTCPEQADLVVDCLFGSGLNKPLDDAMTALIAQMNQTQAQKLACDIPSGINQQGQVETQAFKADVTVTMGALKLALYSDCAKNFVGKVQVADLGVARSIYEEAPAQAYLLDETDMCLPCRSQADAHKGSYGHLHVIAGDKCGAAMMAAQAASCFGAGLVTVVSHKELAIPYHLMQSNTISEKCSALALGMGMGKRDANVLRSWLGKPFPKIVDADLFYEPVLLEFLKDDLILTPHPKEFCFLLKMAEVASIDVPTLQANRLHYVKQFCERYPEVILLLKGANVIIARGRCVYINPLGTVALSKGGSGDVLSGLIGSLLAQGYEALEATKTASLAHSMAARNYQKNNYSLTAEDLIEQIKVL